jgi:hypothetical protein
VTFSDQPIGEAVVDCPLAKKRKPPGWLELELVNEDGSPVPWAEYRVVLPGGAVAKGYLDRNGFARLEGLHPGSCEIAFPNVDPGGSDASEVR